MTLANAIIFSTLALADRALQGPQCECKDPNECKRAWCFIVKGGEGSCSDARWAGPELFWSMKACTKKQGDEAVTRRSTTTTTTTPRATKVNIRGTKITNPPSATTPRAPQTDPATTTGEEEHKEEDKEGEPSTIKEDSNTSFVPPHLTIEEVYSGSLQPGTNIYLKKPIGGGTYGEVSKAYIDDLGKDTKTIGIVKRFKVLKGAPLREDPEAKLPNIKVRNQITHAGKVFAKTSTIADLNPNSKDFHKEGLLMEALGSTLTHGGPLGLSKCKELSEHAAGVLETQMSEALDQLEAEGYSHKDIKPNNILMEDNKPDFDAATPSFKLIDFGLMQPKSPYGVLVDRINLLATVHCVQVPNGEFFRQLNVRNGVDIREWNLDAGRYGDTYTIHQPIEDPSIQPLEKFCDDIFKDSPSRKTQCYGFIENARTQFSEWVLD